MRVGMGLAMTENPMNKSIDKEGTAANGMNWLRSYDPLGNSMQKKKNTSITKTVHICLVTYST